jgi:hypothetical protein
VCRRVIKAVTSGLDFPLAAQAIRRPDRLAAWIRGHRRIENQLHWVRDVSYGVLGLQMKEQG